MTRRREPFPPFVGEAHDDGRCFRHELAVAAAAAALFIVVLYVAYFAIGALTLRIAGALA